MTNTLPLEHLLPGRFDTPDILKKVTAAGRKLAELKGVAASIHRCVSRQLPPKLCTLAFFG